MKRDRRQIIIILFCIAVLVISTLACGDRVSKGGTKRKYTIKVAGSKYYCDRYEWDGADLKLYECGWDGFNAEIKDATNVAIIHTAITTPKRRQK